MRKRKTDRKPVTPTKKVIRELKRMVESGKYSLREISLELGCCEDSVVTWKRDYCIYYRHELQARIADYLNTNIKYFSVGNIKSHLGTKTKEIDYYVRHLKKIGLIRKSGRKWQVLGKIPRWIDYSENTILPANVVIKKVKVRA